MAFDYEEYEPKGDKKNSDFFNEFRPQIYERRKASGIEDLVGNMQAVVMQVDPGTSIATMVELYEMTPYRHGASYIGETHRFHVLHSRPAFPAIILMEPLSDGFEEYIIRVNRMYPSALSIAARWKTRSTPMMASCSPCPPTLPETGSATVRMISTIRTASASVAGSS